MKMKAIEILGVVLNIFADFFHKSARKARRDRWKRVLMDDIDRAKTHEEKLAILLAEAKRQGCVVTPKVEKSE